MVRLSALGDVVMGLHVLATLRERLSSAHIGWVVDDRFASLLEGHPQIDSLYVFRRKRPLRGLAGLARAVRRGNYEVSLDLQGNLKSGFLARLSGAPKRVGFSGVYCREGNRVFSTVRVPSARGHRVRAYLGLVDAAVGEGADAFAFVPAEPVRHGSILMHPTTSAFFVNKRWPAEHFAALGDRLADRLGLPVMITAGPGELAQAEEVQRRMRVTAAVCQPKGLQALRDTLAGASLMIGGDTGPTHLAAALGVPTLGLMGPTDAETLGPYGPRTGAVSAGVRCSPCGSPFSVSRLRWCPDAVCMQRLDVGMAERAAVELMA